MAHMDILVFTSTEHPSSGGSMRYGSLASGENSLVIDPPTPWQIFGLTVGPRQLEDGFRVIYAGFPSFLSFPEGPDTKLLRT